MASIDIRDIDVECINEIVFANSTSSKNAHLTTPIANKLRDGVFVHIEEEYGEKFVSVRIESKEHANNLIKALNKAIALGWLK